MNKTADSKVTFKFPDGKLFLKRIRPKPEFLSAHNTTLKVGGIARYILTRFELKTFAFPAVLTSLSMDNTVLGTIPKRLLITMVKNRFSRLFGHQPVQFSTLQSQQICYVCEREKSSKRRLISMYGSGKSSVMVYRTLFHGSGIHHSNACFQITHDMCIAGFFMLLFELTPVHGASGHISHMDNGNIRIEIHFTKPLPDAITSLLYLEYDNFIRIDHSRKFSSEF